VVRSFRRGALAACAAGNRPQSLEIHPDSQSAAKGVIKVENAFVLTQANGPAAVSARLFNNGSTDQTLQAVQVAGSLSAALSDPQGGRSVTVPAHGTVLLGGEGNPSAVITGAGGSLHDGDVAKAVFVFSTTGPVALPVNVTPATGFFAPYGPGQATAGASPSASPSATPSGSATPGGKNGQKPGRKSTAAPGQSQQGTQPSSTPSTTPSGTATP
jgi:hypothetical protein